MPQTLSQKYRPKNWHELIGQEHVRITLENEIKNNEIAHAYLLSGPRGIGKTTVARLIAKSVNCEKPKSGFEPCNKCKYCVGIFENTALDIIEIDAASHTGVDNVRENIINNARVAPSLLKHKVFIIDEVHMLSISAFNALLKTLEEPPKNTMFILATTEIHKVPVTIISRCQRFDFKRSNIEEIVKRLADIAGWEKIKISKEILEKIAKNSEGYIRDAESFLGQILSLAEKGEVTPDVVELVIPRSNVNLLAELFINLADKNCSAGLELVNKLVDEGIDLNEFSKEFIDFCRRLMLYRVGLKADAISFFDFDKEIKKKMNKRIDSLSVNKLKKLLELFIEKSQNMKYSAIPQLPLELAVVEFTEVDEVENVQDKISNDINNDNDASNNNSGNSNQGSEIDEIKDKTEKNKTKKIKKVVSDNVNITVENIKSKWSQILKNIKKKNHSLALTLKIGELVKYEQGILTIGFKYKFYQDRLGDNKNKIIVEETLMEVLESRVCLECIVGENFIPEVIINKRKPIKEKNTNNTKDNKDDLMNVALKTFGGKTA